MGYESQTKLILNHLQEHKSITDREAYTEYGVRRLSAVIYVLRHKEGLTIMSVPMEAENRFGRKTNFVKYVLCA